MALSAATFSSTLAGCRTIESELAEESGPKVLWRRARIGGLHDSPQVSSGFVYEATQTSVVALDSEEGTPEWNVDATEPSIKTAANTLFLWDHTNLGLKAFEVGSHRTRWQFGFVNSIPRVRNGIVYISGRAGSRSDDGVDTSDPNMYAVELQSGTVLWTLPVGRLSLVSAITDDLVYIWAPGTLSGEGSDYPNGVYALGASDGIERWRFELDTPWGPTRLAGDTLVVGTDGAEDGQAPVYGLDPTDGTEKWRYETQYAIAYPRVTTDQYAFVSARYEGEHLFALDADTGDVEWHLPKAQPLAVDGESLYCIVADRRIACTDIADGSVQWAVSTVVETSNDGAYWGPYIELCGDAVVVNNGEALFGLEAKTGDELWRFTPEKPLQRHWAVDGQRVYAATNNYFYALETP